MLGGILLASPSPPLYSPRKITRIANLYTSPGSPFLPSNSLGSYSFYPLSFPSFSFTHSPAYLPVKTSHLRVHSKHPPPLHRPFPQHPCLPLLLHCLPHH